MNLGELGAELAARGFDYLSTSRQTQYINRAATMLYDAEPWPFLETSTTGTAPLTIADMRTVLYVVDLTNKEVLYATDQRSIRDRDPALGDSGRAECWYFEGDDIAVYPLNTTDTFEVRYIQFPTALATSTDTPTIPDRYHNLIVDGAVYLAYKDTDEFANAAELKLLWDEEVVSMREKLMDRDHQGNKTVQRTGTFDDWQA